MLDKAQDWIKQAIGKVASYHVVGAPRLLIYVILLLIFILVALFIGAWVWQWFYQSKTDLPIIIQMVTALTSASAIAAIGFFGRALIDEDNDGIPDEFQKDKGGGHDGTGYNQGSIRGR